MRIEHSDWSKSSSYAILANKHGGQLLNEVFIYSKDITPSPGYWKGCRIFKMTAVALGPKIFSGTRRVQGRIVNAVVALIASRSDRLTEINLFSSN